MKTLGIDLAADPKKTAAAVLDWTPDTARLTHLQLGVTDEDIVGLFAASDATGVDCPVGWPQALLPFLTGHLNRDAGSVLQLHGIAGRRLLAYRDCDRFVTSITGLIPLSVSADRLAHPAMRCAVIQAKIAQEHGYQPRDGSGRLMEVYPAASLKLWNVEARRYKGKGTAESEIRHVILKQLEEMAPWLDLGPHRDALIASDDTLDSLIASLTARATLIGATLKPGDEHHEAARQEGWIHLPSGPLGDLLVR
jgi:predicted nuclease with RNAse H fold